MPASGFPSRSRMVMSGDPRLALVGRMSRTSMVLARGDPFLGGLFGTIGRGIGAIAKKVLLPALGITTPIPTAPGGGQFGEQPPIPPAPITIRSKGPFITPRTVIPRSAFGVSFPGGPRRRRRMNPLNPRALRRALSRAAAFARFARRALHVTFGKTPRVRFRVGRKKKAS